MDHLPLGLPSACRQPSSETSDADDDGTRLGNQALKRTSATRDSDHDVRGDVASSLLMFQEEDVVKPPPVPVFRFPRIAPPSLQQGPMKRSCVEGIGKRPPSTCAAGQAAQVLPWPQRLSPLHSPASSSNEGLKEAISAQLSVPNSLRSSGSDSEAEVTSPRPPRPPPARLQPPG